MIIGPPANPNLTGVLTPGIAIGMEPNTNPNTIPIKIAARFGSRNVLVAFPNTFSTSCKAASSPTMVRRSPNWSIRFGVANKRIPLRVTRLILMAYVFRSLKEPSFLPFNPGRVMTMSLDTILLSKASQSISFLFQSSGSCLPKRMVRRGASLSVVVINKRSFSCKMVPEVGTLTLSSLHNLEMTNLIPDNSAIFLMSKPKIAGLYTLNVAM